jgi:serine/threonine protein kinase
MSHDSRPPPVAVGAVLAGKYRIERVIGEGGMGVVVAATHLQLDTLVALKFIVQDKGQAVARFVREARSAVRLKSEHVARVSDVGTLEDGMPYMVMEYLEGRDLNDLLHASEPLPIADAVGYVVQACEAVAEAHGLGIVHRDLKPHNLFLTAGIGGRPKVKVLDFGISKTAGMEVALTRSLEIVGTPSYMAPEQLRASKDVDRRADIWSLGVVLYELLTQRLPFEAETLPQLCSMVFSESPVPPTAHRPELPQALSDAVMRCLARAPDGRFAEVTELVSALAPFAPEWAPVRGVMEAPRSLASASARAVIVSSSGASAASDAAWSETELSTVSRPRWKTPALVAAGVVALGGLVVGAWRMGASGARPASETSPGPSSSQVAAAPSKEPPATSATSGASASPPPAPPAPASASVEPAMSRAAVSADAPAPVVSPAKKPVRPKPTSPAPAADKPAPADDPYNTR